MKALELFAGAGGLAMGLELAGFESVGVVEWDSWACATIRENQSRDFPLARAWPLIEGDVRALDLSAFPEDLDLVAGGPPCQPFSLGGKHRAHDDERDMFPATAHVIRTLRPRAFIIENVKGLTRSAFANYYQYILLQLEFPTVTRRGREDWRDHHKRLQREKTSGRLHDGRHIAYNVVASLVNSADHGVPQRRERVFIVGFRDALGITWSFPRETHSPEMLFRDQWVTRAYWERHRVPSRLRPSPPAGLRARIDRERAQPRIGLAETLAPWRTVRDALVGLTSPEKSRPRAILANHVYQPGARAYPGHTGSPLDLPAKTLKAGDHGVPGGENMLVDVSGACRYFTVRESARLQTFPDGYVFHGSWTETMRQLGNAVPVALARVVASSVAEKLIAADMAGAIRRQRGRVA